MSKHEDFLVYTDKDGCMTNVKNPKASPSCHNTMLFTAEKLIAIGPTYDGEIEWFRQHIMSCLTKDRGFIRHPNLRNPTSYDDALGAFAFLKYYKFKKDAQKLYAWFEKNGWNNHDNWLGRFVHFVGFAKFCSFQNITVFDAAAIAGALIVNTNEPKRDTSGKCMLYIMCKTQYGSSRALDAVYDAWKGTILSKYENGMSDVYRIYFGKDHPMAKYAKKF